MIIQIFAKEENRVQEILFKPLEKTNNTLFYKALLRSSDSINMIDYLKDHIEHLDSEPKSNLLNEQVKYKANQYRTALHLAIENSDLWQVKQLLELGANPNIKDDSQQTCFDLAFESAIKLKDPNIIFFCCNMILVHM